MTPLRMSDQSLRGRRVLIREDLNVPLNDQGGISNDARLQAALPTLRHALDAGAQVMVMSHLGRPKEGQFDEAASLRPVADWLQQALDCPVRLERDWSQAQAHAGELVLLENVRFNVGEKANDDELARRYAALCDLFVMDAFGTAHRAHASTHGVARHAPAACAGPLLSAEIDALSQALDAPNRPLVAIVAGSKVSTKLPVLEALVEKVDQLIVGGGIANTFLAAAGHPVGTSLHEADFIEQARALMQRLEQRGGAIPLPNDVVCAHQLAADAVATLKPIEAVGHDEMILDVGLESVAALGEMLARAGTIVWNGPLGVFEIEAFSAGTRALAQAIATSPAFSLAGGGDTLAAIEQFGVANDISYISTGGGALMEYLEGRTLPAIEILQQRASG